MPSTGKVFKNSIIYAISSVVSGGIIFFMMPIYTRVLSAEDYGVYSIITTLSALLVIPLTMGLDGAIGKFHFDLDENERVKFNGTLIFFIIGMCILGGVVYFFCGDIISKFLASGTPFFPFVLLGIGIAMLKPIYAIMQSLFQVRQKANYYLFNSISFLFINLILNLLFLFIFKLGVLSLLLGTFVTCAIFFVISLIEMFHRKYVKASFCGCYLKKGLTYSIPLVPGPLIGALALYLIKFFIEKVMGMSNVGVYDVAIQFGLIVGVAQLASNRALFPFAYESFKIGNTKPVIDITNILIVFYIMLCSGISIFSKEIIFIFSGSSFQSAWLILPIIAMAYCVKSLNYCYENNILYNIKGPKFLLINGVISNIILIGLTIVLIKPIGLFAPAIGLLVSNVFSTIFAFFVGRKLNRVDYGESKIILQFILAILIIFISLIGNYFLALQAFNWINFVIKVILFSLLLFALCLMNKKYFIQLKELIKKRKEKNLQK